MTSGRALVVGAGVGGLTAAIALQRAGWNVQAFEQTRDLRSAGVGGGIHLWHNAMRVYEHLGIAEEVTAAGWRQEVAEFCTAGGRMLARWPIAEHERTLGVPTIGVSRADLHPALVSALGEGALRTDATCVGFREEGQEVVAEFADGKEERADVLVGADGLFSTVRSGLLGRQDEPRYAGYTLWQAIVDYEHDAISPGTFRLFYGPGSRFAYYHVGGPRLYWFGLTDAPQGEQDPPEGPKGRLLELFGDWSEAVADIVEATPTDAIRRMDMRDRPPVSTWGRGRVTLLGDAAHPMTFNVGQGACQAIEDGWVLQACLRESGDIPTGLRTYERRRQARTAPLVKRSWRLGAIARWRSPLACAVRDRAMRVLLSTVALRAHEKDMEKVV